MQSFKDKLNGQWKLAFNLLRKSLWLKSSNFFCANEELGKMVTEEMSGE